MPRLRRTLPLALAALLGLALAACASRPSGPIVRFRYWGDTEEVKIIEGLIHDFEAAHPGVKVKAERKTADGSYSDILLTEFAGGTAPDVIFTATDQFDVLADGGKLMDLEPWLAKEPSLHKSDYYPAMIRRFSVGGHLMLLPRDIAPIACVYYNKALFDRAGLAYPKDDWTWDDLRADALKLTAYHPDGTPQQLGFADDWNLVDAWILAGGGRHVDDYAAPTRFSFAEGGALQGILFRWRLLQVDKVMPSSSDNQSLAGGAAARFMNGTLAMFHSGLWKTPAFRRISAFSWDVAPFPHKAGVKALYWSGGSGYAIRQGVADPALCWELVKFMAGPVGQARLAATGLAQPALRALANSPVFLDGQAPKNKRMLLACAERAQPSPAWKRWSEFGRTVWGPLTDPLWIKGYQGDPAALIKQVQDQGNRDYFHRP
jgi:multiple sugar transport system substrate-binding protein